MKDLRQYYKVLGLKVGASLEEINQAYKQLVTVWHPDHVAQDDPQRLEQAQEMMKALNQARDQLRDYRAKFTQNGKGRRSTPAAKAKQPPPPPPVQTTQRPTQAKQAPPPPPKQQTASATGRASYRQAPHQTVSSPPPRTATPKARRYYSDLSGADFSHTNLAERDLSNHNLSGANLSHCDLSDAFLHQVNLHQANLQGAKLFRANLLEANLQEADLREANLIGADLSGADLSGANLQGAKLWSGDRLMVKLTGTILTGATLPDGQVHE